MTCDTDPAAGYMSLPEAREDIGEYLMGYYNAHRLDQYNCGCPPTQTGE